ncbi:MAG: DUF1614 domain-containing protein [Pseudomonadota bacterium]
MRNRFSPPQLLLILVLLSLLLALVQIGLLTLAFEKLGLSPGSGLVLLLVSLFGSQINLPLVSVTASPPPEDSLATAWRSILRLPPLPFTGKTIIAVNVGGCLVPVFFSIYLLNRSGIDLSTALLGIGMVSTISYLVSRPIPGIGIGMPILVGPLAAAMVGILLAPENSAPLAYICGTLGVLIGADLLRLKDVRRLGAPIASIGGAGTFDGIFITGVVAVLLA